MVMMTRSAHRKTLSFETTSSDKSNNNVVPPWCSSGKPCERKKPRKVASPTWEIRSSYPLRENIWEYLNDKNLCKRKNKKTFCKQTPKNKGPGKKSILLTILFITLGVTIILWRSDRISETDLIKAIPGTKLVSLLGFVERRLVNEECCFRMKHLAAALLRAEEALKSALRVRRTMMLTQTIKLDSQNMYGIKYIHGATVKKGSGTKEWGSRVALWGVVPLWRAAPPADTVLATRRPALSDCWPFSGAYGELIIDLPRRLTVRGISIEHVRPDTARSAPKHFQLYGVLENNTWIKSIDGQYRDNGPARQYYPSLHGNVVLQRLVFRVLSNQGNAQYTCVYRVHLYQSFL